MWVSTLGGDMHILIFLEDKTIHDVYEPNLNSCFNTKMLNFEEEGSVHNICAQLTLERTQTTPVSSMLIFYLHVCACLCHNTCAHRIHVCSHVHCVSSLSCHSAYPFEIGSFPELDSHLCWIGGQKPMLPSPCKFWDYRRFFVWCWDLNSSACDAKQTPLTAGAISKYWSSSTFPQKGCWQNLLPVDRAIPVVPYKGGGGDSFFFFSREGLFETMF